MLPPDPTKKQPRMTAIESWLMIFILGGTISFGFGILQPLLDWFRDDLKSATHYLGLITILTLPHAVGFLFCLWLSRRSTKL